MKKIMLFTVLMLSASVLLAEEKTEVNTTAKYQIIYGDPGHVLRIELKTGRTWALTKTTILQDGADHDYYFWKEVLEIGELIQRDDKYHPAIGGK